MRSLACQRCTFLFVEQPAIHRRTWADRTFHRRMRSHRTTCRPSRPWVAPRGRIATRQTVAWGLRWSTRNSIGCWSHCPLMQVPSHSNDRRSAQMSRMAWEGQVRVRTSPNPLLRLDPSIPVRGRWRVLMSWFDNLRDSWSRQVPRRQVLTDQIAST